MKLLPRSISLTVTVLILFSGLHWFGANISASNQQAAIPAAQDAHTYFAEVRRDTARLRAFLRHLPKGGELHTHLSGLPTPERLLELAVQSKRYRYYVLIPGQPTSVTDRAAYAFIPFPLDQTPPTDRDGAFITPAALLQAETEEQRNRLNAFRRAHTINPDETKPLDIFYEATFQRRSALTSNPEIMSLLVADAVRQAHLDHISYLELQLSPFPFEPLAKLAEREQAINLTSAREHLSHLIDAAQRVNAQLPAQERVEVRFLLSFSRTNMKLFTFLPLAFELAAGSDTIAAAIAGINIVGDEYSQDPQVGQQIAAPAYLQDYLLTLHRVYPTVRLTLHAGEHTKWDWHVRDSILMGAERIGHATNLSASPNSAERDLLRRHRILVEACLTSNKLLLGVPLARHPYLSYLRAGVPVSLNTDDAGIFRTTLTEEFARAVENHPDLTWQELRQLARNSLEYAFVPETTKEILLTRWQQEMGEFEAAKDWQQWLARR
ncbi:MAG: adenosine deaminase [Acidobacteriota bacterium]